MANVFYLASRQSWRLRGVDAAQGYALIVEFCGNVVNRLRRATGKYSAEHIVDLVVYRPVRIINTIFLSSAHL